MNNDDASLYRDLRGFLRSPRPDVRCEATRAVLDLVQQEHSGTRTSSNDDDDDDHYRHEKVSSSTSSRSALLDNIPDLVSLLAKNCSLASGIHHSDDDDDDGVHRRNPQRGASSSRASARAALYALKALLVLTSDAIGPQSQRFVEQLIDAQESSSSSSTAAAAGMNRMMEILLTAPPPTSTAQSGIGGSGGRGGGDDDEGNALTLWRQLVNYAMALVANMTRTEAGAIELVGRSLPDEAVASSAPMPPSQGDGMSDKPTGESESDNQQQQAQMQRRGEGARLPNKPTVELLLARFLNTAQYADPTVNYRAMLHDDSLLSDVAGTDTILSSHPGDPFQHFASVLMNVTQVEQGRLFVLKIRRKPTQEDRDGLGRAVLQALLPQLRSNNPLRRRGVAGTLRNCCLDTDFTWWLLNVVKISTHLLYPLAGPEELDVDEKRGLDPDLWLEGPDKEREPDYLTRLYLVEAMLFLLSSGRQAQATLRRERVSVILKWAEMVEEQEDVSEKMVECMNLLRGDDNNNNKYAEESEDQSGDREDDHVSNIGSPAAAKEVGLSDNYDDVD